jgi:hypothetical protein
LDDSNKEDFELESELESYKDSADDSFAGHLDDNVNFFVITEKEFLAIKKLLDPKYVLIDYEAMKKTIKKDFECPTCAYCS